MIYLDNAATTLVKPLAVARAASRAVCRLATPGRGAHKAAFDAAETMLACREAACELFNVKSPEQVVLTFNATHALNIAIKSLAKRGDKVVISGYEHNAVTRPLHAVGARVVVAAAPLFEPELALCAFESHLTSDTALVVLNHVSNVFGYIQPAERLAKVCRARQIPFVLDASQSAGALDIDFESLGASYICMPGHKGLYGPQGTGLLLCAGVPQGIIEGGTGSHSLSRDMPPMLPDRLEAGTHNMPGIAGLLEGLRFVRKKGQKNILAHERDLVQYAAKVLVRHKGVRLMKSDDLAFQSGVLSFVINNMACETVGEELSKRGIAVRVGLHCAPLAHKTAGTLSTGTVRASVSSFTTMREIDVFSRAVGEIASQYV
ncbi:aminotransferase class V-fold PLP-dependent enzyme [Oscillospiraceae bacterium CM]|nr:aminotransferase class V-fold PLP-dependent enzyme [Oscillospiraceae bacterium CM]